MAKDDGKEKDGGLPIPEPKAEPRRARDDDGGRPADATRPGGAFLVGGRLVDADGKPIKE